MPLFLTGLERRHVCRKERGSDSRGPGGGRGVLGGGRRKTPSRVVFCRVAACSGHSLLSSSPCSLSSSCFFLPAPPGGQQGAPTSPALISRETSGKQLWLQMGEPQQFSVRRRLSSAQRSSRCSSPFSTGSSPQLRVPTRPRQQIETFASTSVATADMGAIACSIEIASSLVTRGYQSHRQINTLCNTAEADFIINRFAGAKV